MLSETRAETHHPLSILQHTTPSAKPRRPFPPHYSFNVSRPFRGGGGHRVTKNPIFLGLPEKKRRNIKSHRHYRPTACCRRRNLQVKQNVAFGTTTAVVQTPISFPFFPPSQGCSGARGPIILLPGGDFLLTAFSSYSTKDDNPRLRGGGQSVSQPERS